jgi:hypothetical protein
MNLVFAPARDIKNTDFDMTAHHVQNASRGTRSSAIDLKINPRCLRTLGYVRGDRVIGHYDDKNRSMTLERVGIDDPRPAYKVRRGNGSRMKSCAFVRFTVTPAVANEFFGSAARRAFDFLEANDKGAVFVEAT